jgi:regulator of nonsense transcripts 2
MPVLYSYKRRAFYGCRFEIQDLFEKLRPNAKIHESLEEAAEALNEIVTKHVQPAGAQENVADASDGTSEKSDDEQDDQRGPIDEEEPEEEDKQEEIEVLFTTNIVNIQIDTGERPDEEEDQEVVLLNRNVEPEVDEEFNREFARMMSEALESRKGSSKPTFDVEPPTVRSRMQSSIDALVDPNRVQFAVLSRRNKQVN